MSNFLSILTEEKYGVNNRGDGGVVVLPHDLVLDQLLTRLLAKFLMRFKCISKLWCFLIILDHALCRDHRARSRSTTSSGLLSLSSIRSRRRHRVRFVRASLCHRKVVFDLFHHFNISDYKGATEVINRLVCL